jgi:hypothetical protein
VINMSKALLVGLFALTFAGLTLGCGPEVPANPTYTKDVKPIFDAHCVRCHGANDMLVSMPVALSDHPPKFCYLQRYENEGDCTNMTDPSCKPGAGSPYCFGLANNYISAPDESSTRMPPLPSQQLNDWEMDVIKLWVAHMAPQ